MVCKNQNLVIWTPKSGGVEAGLPGEEDGQDPPDIRLIKLVVVIYIIRPSKRGASQTASSPAASCYIMQNDTLIFDCIIRNKIGKSNDFVLAFTTFLHPGKAMELYAESFFSAER